MSQLLKKSSSATIVIDKCVNIDKKFVNFVNIDKKFVTFVNIDKKFVNFVNIDKKFVNFVNIDEVQRLNVVAVRQY